MKYETKVSFNYVVKLLSFGKNKDTEKRFLEIEKKEIRKNAESYLLEAIRSGVITPNGDVSIRTNNSGAYRPINVLSKEERLYFEEFQNNKKNVFWIGAYQNGENIYIRFSFKGFHFIDILPGYHIDKNVAFLCIENPVFLKKEADRLLSDMENPICSNFLIDENQNDKPPTVTTEYGYSLPNGYRTEFLDVIFNTLKRFNPDKQTKETLAAELKQTAQGMNLYGTRKISDKNIEAMATICRTLADKTGGYVK